MKPVVFSCELKKCEIIQLVFFHVVKHYYVECKI